MNLQDVLLLEAKANSGIDFFSAATVRRLCEYIRDIVTDIDKKPEDTKVIQ